MLYKLSANHSTFKPIVFNRGLNIVLAEKTSKSGEKASRNALGKTTFIEILDFCLGSDFSKNSKLNALELKDWAFSLELELNSYHFEVTRYIDNPKRIFIHSFCKNIPFDLKQQKDQSAYIDIGEWKEFLGENLFNIKNIETKKAFSPTGRTVLGYFLRKSGAYTDPFTTFKNQKAVQKQTNNAFVLNLLWGKSLELHNFQEETDKHKNLISFFKSQGQTIGKLNSQMVILSDEINKLRKNIQEFNVLPEYREIQDAANILTKNLQSLNNQKIFIKKKLSEYQSIIIEENNNNDINAISKMYKEVQISFSENVTRTLKEVQNFNKIIIQNRKEFLQNEVKQIEIDIKEIDAQIEKYVNERAEKMKILSAHGALDEYSLLQDNLSKKLAQLEEVKSDIKKQQDAEDQIYKIKSQKDLIKHEINQDININEYLKEEISIFNKNSMFLYDMYANLIVDTDRYGNYKFNISREKTSEGIERMDIFCYDLMLIEMFRKNLPQGIDFLIHDSTLYDAVDSRQRAKAIELAAKKAIDCNFQYIFTLNSDQLPVMDFSEDFKYTNYVVRSLTDANVSGSLLGITFSSPGDNEEKESTDI
ncbi:MAG: DUF2326 domain-containing protein [Alphaproteobacteria bacterium]|nr:DUF2326 domain-containing protein [Alphaproteobacteria bacterium]